MKWKQETTITLVVHNNHICCYMSDICSYEIWFVLLHNSDVIVGQIYEY